MNKKEFTVNDEWKVIQRNDPTFWRLIAPLIIAVWHAVIFGVLVVFTVAHFINKAASKKGTCK